MNAVLQPEAAAATRVNLLGLPRAELEAFVAGLGSRPYRARQLMHWLYKRGIGDFALTRSHSALGDNCQAFDRTQHPYGFRPAQPQSGLPNFLRRPSVQRL